jgi:prepilin-type processing-associated H-X9-DG protein
MAMRLARQRPHTGFSLVELFVVLGVIGLFLSILLPAVQQARESAARVACLSHLKQIGQAVHHYHGIHGRLPSGPIAPAGKDPTSLLTWFAMILPQIERESLWIASVQACAVSQQPWQNPPHVGFATVIKLYVCPDDPRLLVPLLDRDGLTAAYTSYIGCGGTLLRGGVMGRPGIRLADITDGTSNTLMVGERPPPATLQAGQWYPHLQSGGGAFGALRGPDEALAEGSVADLSDACAGPFRFGPGRLDNPCDRYHFWSLHPGGAHFLMADGSVHFLSYDAGAVLPALATRAGGEVASLP